ncbi:MAG: 5-formyltetrahydrofolate cyclo-ligase [Planctomycetota bacterium]
METKRTLRASMRARLQALPSAERAVHSRVACGAIARAPWFEAAQSVFVFVSLRDEIDTASLLEGILAARKRLVVPRVVVHTGQLEGVAIGNLGCLRTSSLGVREPEGGQPVALASIDVAIVPGLAFDRTGGRLGRGGGFYDRCLGRHPDLVTCGLAFTHQIVDRVPMQDFDCRVHWLATEDGVTLCRG